MSDYHQLLFKRRDILFSPRIPLSRQFGDSRPKHVNNSGKLHVSQSTSERLLTYSKSENLKERLDSNLKQEIRSKVWRGNRLNVSVPQSRVWGRTKEEAMTGKGSKVFLWNAVR
jgi:hypothetical protein